jgi:hypothetical protein
VYVEGMVAESVAFRAVRQMTDRQTTMTGTE